jgi:hypothetical protein
MHYAATSCQEGSSDSKSGDRNPPRLELGGETVWGLVDKPEGGDVEWTAG